MLKLAYGVLSFALISSSPWKCEMHCVTDNANFLERQQHEGIEYDRWR